ncbi:MAG TPA: hypothetical protein VLG68_08865 [Gammaproteobacteria bacterium]|nr:hypothetical protein [Gammaproteobacteria bacterium]
MSTVMVASDAGRNALFYAAAISALFLGAMVYLPGLPGDFVFDDYGSITGNSALLIQHLDPGSLFHAMLSAPVGGLLRPLSTLSFILDASFFGLSPGAFKLTNIFIHLLAGALLGCVALEVLRAHRAISERKFSNETIRRLSLAVMLLWLVHPLNLTAVLYVVQRDTSLAAVFTAAAVLSYLAGRRRQIETGEGRLLIWIAAPLFMLLGMLCKENAALTPVYTLVTEITLLGFRTRGGSRSREITCFYGIFLALPLLALCGLLALRPEFLGNYVNRDFTLYERLLSECRVLLDYLRWALIPDPRQLGLFHDDIAPSRGILQPLSTLPCALITLALVPTAFLLRRHFPLISFSILWFIAGHLMESTVLPLDLVYEHRNYLPLFGLVLGGVATLYASVQRVERVRLATAAVAVYALILAGTTAIRAHEWRTELSFAQYESAHHPHSPRALSELGETYMWYIQSSHDTSLIPKVLDAEQRSKLADHGSINQDVGVAYMFAILHDLPQAKHYLQATAEDAKSAIPSSSLQIALVSLANLAQPDYRELFPGIIDVYTAALANPRLMRDNCYAANIWNTSAMFLIDIEEIPGALDAMHKAVTLCPVNPRMRANLARMFLEFNDTHDAKEQIDALRALHDFRFLLDLQKLEREYDQAIAASGKK